MTRAGIAYCCFTVLLAGYIVFGAIASARMANAARLPQDMPIVLIVDRNPGVAGDGFVTPRQVMELIEPEVGKAAGNASSFNTHAVEKLLSDVNNIENVQCYRRSDDRISLHVTPMQPVARIFDGEHSYYINRTGKELTASLAYRADVPVVQGTLGGRTQISDIIPLIEHISENKTLSSLVTSIVVDNSGDVLLIPPVRGHLVNFGDPTRDMENKFARLATFYREVMPVKGWDFYDTISVKYRGQIVASRRQPRQRDPLLIADPTGDANDEVDVSAMDANLVTAEQLSNARESLQPDTLKSTPII